MAASASHGFGFMVLYRGRHWTLRSWRIPDCSEAVGCVSNSIEESIASLSAGYAERHNNVVIHVQSRTWHGAAVRGAIDGGLAKKQTFRYTARGAEGVPTTETLFVTTASAPYENKLGFAVLSLWNRSSNTHLRVVARMNPAWDQRIKVCVDDGESVNQPRSAP